MPEVWLNLFKLLKAELIFIFQGCTVTYFSALLTKRVNLKNRCFHFVLVFSVLNNWRGEIGSR